MLKGASLLFGQCPLLKRLILLALVLNCSKITTATFVGDNSPILDHSDQVRLRHLYTNNAHTHLHLQITPEGEVSGTQDKNLYSILEIKSIKPSILVIRGMMSARYLCMDSKHRLYGSMHYIEDDCNFREVPLADGYNLYFSEKNPAPLTLTPLKGGKPSGRQMSHFLPLLNNIHLESMPKDESLEDPDIDPGSDDPLGMKNISDSISPSLE
ncbi:fibroblast growth factor 21 [Discoglossus pictus]